MVPLTILGGMITSLGPGKCSDRDLQLLFAFMRTCIAIAEEEPGEMAKVEKHVVDVIASPRDRLKDKVQNMLTLIGALAILPHEAVARVMRMTAAQTVPPSAPVKESKGDDNVAVAQPAIAAIPKAAVAGDSAIPKAAVVAGESTAKHGIQWRKLWLGLIAETLRRGMGGRQNDMTPAEEIDMVTQIMNGWGPDVLASGASSIIAALSGTAHSATNSEGDKGGASAKADPQNRSEETSSWRNVNMPRMDKRVREAWALLGRESADLVPGGTKATTMTTCRRRVREWADKALTEVDSEGRSILKRMVFNYFPDKAAAEGAAKAKSGASRVTWQNLQVAGKILRAAAQKAETKPRHIQTAAKFFDWWWSVERKFKATIDARGGVAPSEWLASVRKALTADAQTTADTHKARQGNLFKCLQNIPRVKMDCTQMAHACRVMSVQALLGRRNKAARGMLSSKSYFDIGAATAIRDFNRYWRTEFQRQSLTQREKLKLQALGRRSIRHMAQTRDIWCFIGLLNHTIQERNGQEWTELLLLFQHKVDGVPIEIPLRQQKLTVLLSGRLFDEIDSFDSTSTRVFAKGNRIIPSKTLRDQLIACFKYKDDYFEIETRLRGTCGYTYRSSNIPNRHGHSNENPSAWAMNQ